MQGAVRPEGRWSGSDPVCGSLGSGEIKIADYARRSPGRRISGRGFESRRLHQTTPVVPGNGATGDPLETGRMLIPFEEIARKFDTPIHGAIHVGAHLAEEAAEYEKAGVRNVIWIEGNPELTAALRENTRRYPGHRIITAVVGDVDGKELDFLVASNRQSSSLLPLGKHAKYHPDVYVERIDTVTTRRIDALITPQELAEGQYTFLNLDLQGGELLAMRGMGELLERMNWVYLEVNLTDIYEGCPLLSDVDEFLMGKGFARKRVVMTEHMWGDALYRRQKLSAPARATLRASRRLYIVSTWRRGAMRRLRALAVNRLLLTRRLMNRMLGKP